MDAVERRHLLPGFQLKSQINSGLKSGGTKVVTVLVCVLDQDRQTDHSRTDALDTE